MTTLHRGQPNAVKTGWLAYLDVYGFSSLVEHDDNDEIADRLLNVHNASSKELGSIDLHQFFSDSIFLFARHGVTPEHSSQHAFERVSAAVRGIVNHSVKQDLFIRGSLAYGQVTIRPNIILGRPIIRAYAREQSLPFPIVVVPEREFEYGSIDSPMPIEYIETKSGIVSGSIIIPHSRTGACDRALENAARFAKDGPENVALAWRRYAQFLEKKVVIS